MRRWQTFSLFALLELVCTQKMLSQNLTPSLCTTLYVHESQRWQPLSAKVPDFLFFCTIGNSMYQKSTLPYTLFLTYLPQAYSPLECYRQTDWRTDRENSSPLLPQLIFFSTERAAPYPQAQLCWAGRTVGWIANLTSCFVVKLYFLLFLETNHWSTYRLSGRWSFSRRFLYLGFLFYYKSGNNWEIFT